MPAKGGLKRATSVAAALGRKDRGGQEQPFEDLGRQGGVMGLGKGRTELERLMSLYKVRPIPGQAGILSDAESEKNRDLAEKKEENEFRTVDNIKIEEISGKPPEHRQAHEIEALRKELDKMKVFKKLYLTTNDERDLCKAAMLRSIPPNHTLITQGQIGDRFYVVLEGLLNESSYQGDPGKGIYPGDSLGEDCLLGDSVEEQVPHTVTVTSTNNAKLLEFKRAEYDRYIRPAQKVERERIRQFIPTIPEFKNLSATRIAEIEAAVKHQRFFMGDFICAEGEFLNSLMFIMSGHCIAKKKVVPHVSRRRAELLPSPLEREGGAGHIEEPPSEVELDIKTLYCGAGIDPDAAISRNYCNYSVQALSCVECIAINCSQHLGDQNSLLDHEMLAVIRRRCALLPSEDALQSRCRNDTSWNVYKEHTRSHIVFQKRRENLLLSAAFSSQREVFRGDLMGNVSLDYFPDWINVQAPRNGRSGKGNGAKGNLATLSDGRWPSKIDSIE